MTSKVRIKTRSASNQRGRSRSNWDPPVLPTTFAFPSLILSTNHIAFSSFTDKQICNQCSLRLIISLHSYSRRLALGTPQALELPNSNVDGNASLYPTSKEHILWEFPLKCLMHFRFRIFERHFQCYIYIIFTLEFSKCLNV